MRILKVLFIPHPMPSHLIPLISLAKMLDKDIFSIAFLVPQELHEYVKNNNFEIINLHHNLEDKLAPELTAIAQFDPDVIIDDHNYYTAFSSRIMNKPRISVVRKGTLPFETVTDNYKHSSGVIGYFNSLRTLNLKELGLWQPETISDLFKGDFNIIPSIPSLDFLPPELENDKSYAYSGPLLLTDNEMSGSLSYTTDIISELNAFFEKNKSRKIVYFTKGIADPPEILDKAAWCIDSLLKREDVAVITNIAPGLPYDHQRCFSSRFLPMHYVCERADLMIHQCGSGTYNFQLLYEIPGIVLGSKCYDRDDIGMQLEKVGAASFISADLDNENWYRKFDFSVDQLLNVSSENLSKQQTALTAIKEEMSIVRNDFRLDKMIRKAIFNHAK